MGHLGYKDTLFHCSLPHIQGSITDFCRQICNSSQSSVAGVVVVDLSEFTTII